jgi:hypothetical protein
MSDRQIIGQPVPTNSVPIAVKDSDGNLNWPSLDSSGNLKVAATGGGGGAVTIADGADVAEGATTDAKVTGDNTGTISAKLRGINTILANVWDSLNGWLKVSIQNTSLTVAQATASSLNATVIAAGDIAAGSSDSGNPVKIGLKAAAASPTTLTAGQRANVLGDLWGRVYVRTGIQAPVASTWTQVHIPNSATQATKSQASGGGNVRNVCTGFTVTFLAGSTAPSAATPLTVAVIDGASGGTTYLWRTNICVPATANAIVSFNRSGIWLVGSKATAMTIEFSGAGGTNTYQSVSMDGVLIDEGA